MIEWLSRLLRRSKPSLNLLANTDSPAFYATLHGVPCEALPAEGQIVFQRDPQGAWRTNLGDLTQEVENCCVSIHDYLADAIFGGLQSYYRLLPTFPGFLSEAGLNSESPLSRDQFERLLKASSGISHINHALYLYDCRKLVSGIQECTKELVFLLGEFYRAFNFDLLFYPPVHEDDGLRYISSPATTAITAVLNFIFIRMHSLLDYTTKLVFEVAHLHRTFTHYPRLSSSKIQYGDYKKLNIQTSSGSFFEECELITTVETTRNLIIHDGLLDDIPKVYKVVMGGTTIEKFILFPDMKQGRLLKFNNRKSFFATEDKINLRLPQLVAEFQSRQVKSLELVKASLVTHCLSRSR